VFQSDPSDWIFHGLYDFLTHVKRRCHRQYAEKSWQKPVCVDLTEQNKAAHQPQDQHGTPKLDLNCGDTVRTVNHFRSDSNQINHNHK